MEITGNKNKLIPILFQADTQKIFVLKDYQKPRNLNQNSKYWKLLNELALQLNMSVEELHKQMLKDYSVRYEILVPANVKIRGIEYYDIKSKIKKDNKEFLVYHIYTPSHELTTKEFGNLLSGLVQECENVGIPTELDSD